MVKLRSIVVIESAKVISDTGKKHTKTLSPSKVTSLFKEAHLYLLFRILLEVPIYLFCLRFYVPVNRYGYDETIFTWVSQTSRPTFPCNGL